MATPFTSVYNRFLGKITDDMYLELTPTDTIKDLRNLLVNALPNFEFPRIDLFNYNINTITKQQSELTPDDFALGVIWPDAEEELPEDPEVMIEASEFNQDLSSEEINILALLMMQAWTQRQVTSIENTRMKYSGSDMKFTSQANHLSKLLSLLEKTEQQSLHMQRLYRRRKLNEKGMYESNWSVLRTSS